MRPRGAYKPARKSVILSLSKDDSVFWKPAGRLAASSEHSHATLLRKANNYPRSAAVKSPHVSRYERYTPCLSHNPSCARTDALPELIADSPGNAASISRGALRK